MKRIRPMSVLAVGAVLLTVACSSDDSPGTSDGNLKIGFAVPAANQTYWTAYINAVKAEAADLGVEVVFADAKDDANTQTEQVASLVVSGVDGIVLVPTDTIGPIGAVATAADADVALITSNRVLETTYGGAEGADPRVHVGFDDVSAGRLQGELLVDACEGRDPCNVVQLMATLGSSPQVQRTEGLDEVLAEHPNITILDRQADDFDSNKAVDLTLSYLQKYDEIDFLIAQYDEVAVAAARTIEESGRAGEIGVIGLGGSINGVDAVESGQMLSTVWVSPSRDGVAALETIVAIAKGEALTGVEEINSIPTVPVEAVKVTEQNVADYPGEW